MAEHGREQFVLFADEGVGLPGAIAAHDTTLGPAVGGLRIWPHESEAIALVDVLRLSEAMTFKSAVAGLDLGGGKAIVIGDPAVCKTEGLFRSFGRQVEEPRRQVHHYRRRRELPRRHGAHPEKDQSRHRSVRRVERKR